jgi:YVTN family beta-propeller protein
MKQTITIQLKKMLAKALVPAVLILAIFLSLSSCKPEDERVYGSYERGILIVNEGLMNAGTAEITYYNPATKQTQQNIFGAANSNRALGDVAQSMTYYNGLYYIVVNNSNKIEVVDMEFKSVTAFENIQQPRYLQFAGGKCYVSSWGNGGQVYVLSPTTGSLIKTIATGSGSERMMLIDGMIYVANSGGWGHGTTISVINTGTDEVEQTIEVGDNPIDMVLDNENMLWILLAGKYNDIWTEVTGAGLVKINPRTNQKVLTVDFAISTGTAVSLCTDGQILYYLYNGGINRMGTNMGVAPASPFILGYFYKLYLNNSKFYACDPGNWQTSGKVYGINPVTGVGTDTITTGLIPSFILFRH